MKVLIDAHMLGNNETGNETYVENLLSGLSAIDELHVVAAINHHLITESKFLDESIQKKTLHPAGNIARLLYGLPTLCRQSAADVLHVTYVAPFFIRCPLVVSVHDISFKRFPEFFSPRDRLLFATLLPMSLRRANAVLTISKHAKAEILESWPFLKGRVHVIPLAAASIFRPVIIDKLAESILEKHGITSQFILAVGNLQPRKNIGRLIQAFSHVHQSFKNYKLVIVGKDHWQSSTLYTLVENLGLVHSVIFTGYVPADELAFLYNAAQLFVYPSLYEGFGLPILEAMACGTPVISSNTSSMPEVTGSAALMVDPTNIEEITQAIFQVLSDSDLRQRLSELGLLQAQCFSWQRTARETLVIYKSVVA